MDLNKILPPRLQAGQAIGVIAPADPVLGVCPKESIQRGYQYLKSKGFDVVEGRSVKIDTQHHTAGTPDVRIEDIHDFVKNDNIGCIMAFWGGFNTNQILDGLDYDLIKKYPKIFVGYSDITALTTAITTQTGLVTFSGPGVISFAKPEPFEYTWEYFRKVCIQPSDELLVEASRTYADDLYFLRTDNNHRITKTNGGMKVFKPGDVVGEVVAGNLQTLLLLQGTKYFPKLKNKVLFIEEDETSTPAHLDRFLCQCKQSGWFDQIAGLVIGRFTEQSGFSQQNSLEDILGQYFRDAVFPVLYNADFGHSDPLITIPNGGMVTMHTAKRSIKFQKAVS